MEDNKFNKIYNELTMYQRLIIAEDTLRFLLDTNEPTFHLNKKLKQVINFVSDEIEYAIGL